MWLDGGRYEGEYVRGEKAGQGAYFWSDGACYQGTWKAGKRQGAGVFTFPQDGTSWKGLWCDGLAAGTGLWRWQDGLELEETGPDERELGQASAPPRWRAAAEKVAAGGAIDSTSF